MQQYELNGKNIRTYVHMSIYKCLRSKKGITMLSFYHSEKIKKAKR